MLLAFAFVVALALIGLGAWYFKDSGFGLVSIGLPIVGLVIAGIGIFNSQLQNTPALVDFVFWLLFVILLYLGLRAIESSTEITKYLGYASLIATFFCFIVMASSTKAIYVAEQAANPNAIGVTKIGLLISILFPTMIKYLLFALAALGVLVLIASNWKASLKPFRMVAAIVGIVALVVLAIWGIVGIVKKSPVSQAPATAVPTQVSLAEEVTPTAIPATAIPATTIPATAIPATAVPATAIPATPSATAPTGLLKNQPAEYYFSGVSLVCYPVNGPWVEAFAKGQTYEVKGDSNVFAPDTFKYFEGTLVIGQPIDRHYTFEVTKDSKFTAIQGNIWDCGVVISDKDKITTLFQSTDKKWQNWDSQDPKPFHPMAVLTGYNSWYYNAGVKPAWALNEDDTNLVCPFTKPEMSNPLGEIQADGTFIGTPGKAGCDFLAIFPDGKAVRYKGVIERFPYPTGTRFFLFDPKFTNKELKTLLNLGKID